MFTISNLIFFGSPYIGWHPVNDGNEEKFNYQTKSLDLEVINFVCFTRKIAPQACVLVTPNWLRTYHTLINLGLLEAYDAIIVY